MVGNTGPAALASSQLRAVVFFSEGEVSWGDWAEKPRRKVRVWENGHGFAGKPGGAGLERGSVLGTGRIASPRDAKPNPVTMGK